MAYKLWLLRPSLGQGGAERVTVTLLQKLNRQQFDLKLVLVRHEGELLTEVPADLPVVRLGSRNLWTSVPPLVKLLRRERPDIVFSPGGANVPLIIAKLLSRIPVRVVISERNTLAHTKLTPKRRLMIGLACFFYRWADGITAVSEGVKQDMVAKLGLPPERIQVLYNPVVDDQMLALAQEPVEHPWFQEEIPIILGVGRLVLQKNFSLLIRAFAQIQSKQPVRLVILGEGPLRTELFSLAQQLGVAEHVCLPGFDKNPFKYMAKATVFVLSSLHEGLPGALIQAMACGTAVISTDCPFGPNEIITPEQDGILIPINDMSTLVAAIQRLLSEPEYRLRLAQKARLSAQKFNVATAVNTYETNFLNLVPNHAPH